MEGDLLVFKQLTLWRRLVLGRIVEPVEAVHGKLQEINCCVVGSQDLCVLASELAGWVVGWLVK